jgi:ADP-ribose pyrophosphatase YjhB (NUDIX family)
VTEPADWLRWARRVQAIAQNGLTYTEGPYDRERYQELHSIAVEMLAVSAGTDPARITALFVGESGYVTPKVDVRGVVFQHGRILLVREREDGLWTLPGGWADAGQSPSQAVVKEIHEESGYEVEAVRMLAVLDREAYDVPPLPWYVYKLFIRCELRGGGARAGLETDGVGFFAEDEIPPLSTGRVTRGQIARMFQHLREPGLPCDFD